MDFLEFIKNHLQIINPQYVYKINSELNFKFESDKDNVIVRLQQGNRYKKGVVLPITILVTSKDLNNAMQVWSQLVLEVSDKNYIEGTDNYYMLFMTPSVNQMFDEVTNNYYSVISIMGTIVETNETNDIVKVEVRRGSNPFEEVELIGSTLTTTLTVDTEQTSGLEILRSLSTGTVIAGSLDIYPVSGQFLSDLRNMRTGILTNQTRFDFKFTWQDGIWEIHNCLVTSQGFVKRRGELSTMQIQFSR